MTISPSPENKKRFQALQAVLGIIKNNGNNTARPVSQNEVLEYLFLHAPIMKEVEDFMKKSDIVKREISEQREALIKKGGRV
jgi:hypothetical protein